MYNAVKTLQKKITKQLLSPPDRNRKEKNIIGINIVILIVLCGIITNISHNSFLSVHIMLIPIFYGIIYISVLKSVLVSLITVSTIGIISMLEKINPSNDLCFLWLYRVGMVTMGTLIISILIHQLRRFYKSATIKSQTDFYTGQWNFLKLKEDYLLLIKTKKCKSCTFVMYEIDNLDLTNRFEGYKEGWEAVKGLMERAMEGFETQIVYSISQNRYLIMIPDTLLKTVILSAENFYELSKNPFRIYDIAIYLNIKIGIAHMTTLEDNLYEVFRRLGSALEQTEKSNKQIVLYDEEFTTKRKENYQLQLALNHACRNNEFYLHYQPKVYFHDESVEGVEALLRWDNIPKGITIAQIIDMAEETGLITEIIKQVVLKAVCQLSEWKNKVEKSA